MPHSRQEDSDLHKLQGVGVRATGSLSGFALSPTRWACVILVVGFAVRLAPLLLLEMYRQPSRAEIHNLAISLVHSGIYGDPFVVPTGPSAHAPPLYPLVLSLIYRVFGTGSAGECAHLVMNAAVASLQYALLPTLAVSCGLGVRVGAAAGLLGALVPLNLVNELRGNEASFAALFLVGLSIYTLRSWTHWTLVWKAAALYGSAWGMGFLLTTSLVPVFAGLAFVSLMRYRQRSSRAALVKQAVAMLAFATLPLVPWTIRNKVELGSPIWLRSNFGLELSFSNSDGAQPRLADNQSRGRFESAHPHKNIGEAMKVREMGEVAYSREQLGHARHWILAHPVRFTELTALRFTYFWFPLTIGRASSWQRSAARWAQTIASFVLTLGAFLGLALLSRRNRDAVWLFAAIWLTFPLVYYLVQFSTRYRYPIQWTFWLLSAVAVEWAYQRLVARRTRTGG